MECRRKTLWGLFGKKSFFPYVGEIGNDVTEEIRGTVTHAQGILGLSDGTGGRDTAAAINETVDRILESGGMPEEFADLEDAGRVPGCAVRTCASRGAAVEMEGAGENAGNVDGTNGNTVLLLYNMLETIDRKLEKQKYLPVA